MHDLMLDRLVLTNLLAELRNGVSGSSQDIDKSYRERRSTFLEGVAQRRNVDGSRDTEERKAIPPSKSVYINGGVPVSVRNTMVDPQDEKLIPVTGLLVCRTHLLERINAWEHHLSASLPKCPRMFNNVFGTNSTRKSAQVARAISHKGHHKNI